MKALKIALLIMLPVSFVFGGLLALERQPAEEAYPVEEVVEEINEVAVLKEYLETQDLYLFTENLEEALSVSANEVYENIGNRKYHVIDLRNPEDFYPSHIEGAVLVEQAAIYDYLKSIPLNLIDKVVLVCYAGQRASYITGLLRLMGVDNAYFLRWGMSAWQLPIARDNWLRNLSNDYANQMALPVAASEGVNELPMIFTFQTSGREILNARIAELLQEDFANVRVRAQELMADPGQFQVIVSDPVAIKDNFPAPGGSIWLPMFDNAAIENNLTTLPAFNPIVVASVTGQTGGLVAAFLRTLGYDARFLSAGVSTLAVNPLREQNYKVFSQGEIRNFRTTQTEPPDLSAAPARAIAGC